MYDNYVLRQQIWEDHQEYLAEDQLNTAVEIVNKLYNNKGYTICDYEKYEESYY